MRPLRVGTGRFYTPKDRIRIELILKGKQLGFTLSEIETLILGPSKSADATGDQPMDISEHLDPTRIAAQISFLKRKRDQIASAIDELREALDRQDGKARSS